MVNLVFVVAAVLTQLFLATTWGKAVLAWPRLKQAFVKAGSNPQSDTKHEDLHGCDPFETDTEQQRLLAPAHGNSMQSFGPSGAQTATQLEMLYEGPAGFSVEMAGFDALRHYTPAR